jgi:hypothetical protein
MILIMLRMDSVNWGQHRQRPQHVELCVDVTPGSDGQERLGVASREWEGDGRGVKMVNVKVGSGRGHTWGVRGSRVWMVGVELIRETNFV